MTPQLIGYTIEELMGDSYHSYYLSHVRYFTEPQRNSSQFIRVRTPTAGSYVGNVYLNLGSSPNLPITFIKDNITMETP